MTNDKCIKQNWTEYLSCGHSRQLYHFNRIGIHKTKRL